MDKTNPSTLRPWNHLVSLVNSFGGPDRFNQRVEARNCRTFFRIWHVLKRNNSRSNHHIRKLKLESWTDQRNLKFLHHGYHGCRPWTSSILMNVRWPMGPCVLVEQVCDILWIYLTYCIYVETSFYWKDEANLPGVKGIISDIIRLWDSATSLGVEFLDAAGLTQAFGSRIPIFFISLCFRHPWGPWRLRTVGTLSFFVFEVILLGKELKSHQLDFMKRFKHVQITQEALQGMLEPLETWHLSATGFSETIKAWTEVQIETHFVDAGVHLRTTSPFFWS